MESKDEVEKKGRKPRILSTVILLVVVISVALAGWALIVVSNSGQVPSSDFVTLPNTHLSTQGSKVTLISVSGVVQKGLTVGVQGYLKTTSGTPVTGAKVYMTYYLRGAYRTQVTTTDQNGHFVAYFPMNWTGWLPLTLSYFGDDQHQGLTHIFSVSGEGPYLTSVLGFQ
jgi:hypothetical protein